MHSLYTINYITIQNLYHDMTKTKRNINFEVEHRLIIIVWIDEAIRKVIE